MMLWIALAWGAPWSDGTEAAIGETSGWTNKTALADLNGDGRLDLLFANGGDYASPGDPEQSQIFFNNGDGTFTDRSDEVLGTLVGHTRAIKAADLNGDGFVDLFLANAYGMASFLLLGDGSGGFAEHPELLPDVAGSFGDVEVGDVDGDGDLDLALADWGTGNPMSNEGGSVQVWINDGGEFSVAATPSVPRGMSWDMELADVDNDADLDALMSCKVCDGGALLLNDGAGVFTDASDQLPQSANNYDYEAMDLDGDGDLDLTTINDGAGLQETVLENDGGTFTDVSASWWPESENLGLDDNVLVYLDYDSDGDADLLVGSLSEPDRLLLNDGTGTLALVTEQVLDGPDSYGTLGMAVGDLNEDGRSDVVMSQGEVDWPELIFFGTDAPVDTAPPVIALLTEGLSDGAEIRSIARVHDNHSPISNVEFSRVDLEWEDDAGAAHTEAMTWMGEYLWQVTWTGTAVRARVCADDAAGNEACSDWTGADNGDTDANDDPPPSCGCRSGTVAFGWALTAFPFVIQLMRRRRNQ